MDPRQRVVVEDPSSICSLGTRPQLIQGFLLDHLRSHFVASELIEHQEIKNYLWRATAGRNQLFIDSITRWDATTVGARPAVLLRRNDWQLARVGIGNRMQMPTVIDGWDRYSAIMQGSHTLFCMAREAAECELLAAEVYLELLGFGPEIRQRAQLLRFELLQVGRPMPVLESREHFGIPITVAYAHNQSWTVRKQTPVLGSVDLDLRSFRP